MVLAYQTRIGHLLHFIAELEDEVSLGFGAITGLSHSAQVGLAIVKFPTNFRDDLGQA